MGVARAYLASISRTHALSVQRQMATAANIQVPPHRRGPIAAEYSSPGPGYLLPNLTGQAKHDLSSRHAKNPAFSFGARTKLFANHSSPGPCYNPPSSITRRGKDGSPCYSLHFRSKEIEKFRTPGPGAYSVTNKELKSAPKFSFGQRQARRKTDATPAPNRYSLPGVLNKTTQSRMSQAPQITMAPRLKGVSGSNVNNPGPGTYSIVNVERYGKQAPAFSMRGNRKDQMVPTQSGSMPGPGQYLKMSSPANLKSAPQHSFGIKHTPYITPALFDLE